MCDRDWFLVTYDEYMTGERDGASLEKARDAGAHAYADAVESGAIRRVRKTLVEEGRALFDEHVNPARKQRRSSMRRQLEYVIAYLTGNPEEEADMSSILGHAYMLGDGRDKTLDEPSGFAIAAALLFDLECLVNETGYPGSSDSIRDGDSPGEGRWDHDPSLSRDVR